MVERITVASDAMGGDTVEIAELRAPCGRRRHGQGCRGFSTIGARSGTVSNL